jgi:hypothetical protein
MLMESFVFGWIHMLIDSDKKDVGGIKVKLNRSTTQSIYLLSYYALLLVRHSIHTTLQRRQTPLIHSSFPFIRSTAPCVSLLVSSLSLWNFPIYISSDSRFHPCIYFHLVTVCMYVFFCCVFLLNPIYSYASKGLIHAHNRFKTYLYTILINNNCIRQQQAMVFTNYCF